MQIINLYTKKKKKKKIEELLTSCACFETSVYIYIYISHFLDVLFCLLFFFSSSFRTSCECLLTTKKRLKKTCGRNFHSYCFFIFFYLQLSLYKEKKMEISLDKVATSVLFVIMTTLSCMILNWVWLRPKYLERCLRKQGLVGNSYRLFFGDSKDSSMMIKQACSKPIELSGDIVPLVLPFEHHTVKHYGMYVYNKLNYLKILLQQTQIISHSFPQQ